MRKKSTKELLPLQIPGLDVRGKRLGRRGPAQENRDSNDKMRSTQVCTECENIKMKTKLKIYRCVVGSLFT